MWAGYSASKNCWNRCTGLDHRRRPRHPRRDERRAQVPRRRRRRRRRHPQHEQPVAAADRRGEGFVVGNGQTARRPARSRRAASEPARGTRAVRGRLPDRPDADGRGDGRAEREELELELRHDPEVAAAATEAPEQVGMLVGARVDDAAVRRDHRGGTKRIAAEAVLAAKPAEPAAQREARDAGFGDDAAGSRQPVRLRGRVEIPPSGATADTGPARVRVHLTRCDIADRSTTSEPSPTARPATLWPPPRMETGRPSARASARAATTSSVDSTRAMTAGRCVDHAVPDLARLVVGAVVRSEQALGGDRRGRARRGRRVHRGPPVRAGGRGSCGAVETIPTGRYGTNADPSPSSLS